MNNKIPSILRPFKLPLHLFSLMYYYHLSSYEKKITISLKGWKLFFFKKNTNYNFRRFCIHIFCPLNFIRIAIEDLSLSLLWLIFEHHSFVQIFYYTTISRNITYYMGRKRKLNDWINCYKLWNLFTFFFKNSSATLLLLFFFFIKQHSDNFLRAISNIKV